jgi:hypothetical protein
MENIQISTDQVKLSNPSTNAAKFNEPETSSNNLSTSPKRLKASSSPGKFRILDVSGKTDAIHRAIDYHALEEQRDPFN